MPQGDILGFAPPLCLTRDEADIVARRPRTPWRSSGPSALRSGLRRGGCRPIKLVRPQSMAIDRRRGSGRASIRIVWEGAENPDVAARKAFLRGGMGSRHLRPWRDERDDDGRKSALVMRFRHPVKAQVLGDSRRPSGTRFWISRWSSRIGKVQGHVPGASGRSPGQAVGRRAGAEERPAGVAATTPGSGPAVSRVACPGAALGQRHQPGDDVRDDIVEADPVRCQRPFDGVVACDPQQLVGQRRRAVRAGLEVVEPLGQRGIGAHAAQVADLQGERGQRRAQLVGGVRQERPLPLHLGPEAGREVVHRPDQRQDLGRHMLDRDRGRVGGVAAGDALGDPGQPPEDPPTRSG